MDAKESGKGRDAERDWTNWIRNKTFVRGKAQGKSLGKNSREEKKSPSRPAGRGETASSGRVLSNA